MLSSDSPVSARLLLAFWASHVHVTREQHVLNDVVVSQDQDDVLELRLIFIQMFRLESTSNSDPDGSRQGSARGKLSRKWRAWP